MTTLTLVEQDATPESLLVTRIRNAWLSATGYRADWVDATLDLAQALAEARALRASDQDFGNWLDQNGFTYIGKNDRAALIGMATDFKAARQMLEATDRTSWQHIWKENRQKFRNGNAAIPTQPENSAPDENTHKFRFPHVRKPTQTAKSSSPGRISNQQRTDDILSLRDQGFTRSEIVEKLGLTKGQVDGILFRNKDKKPKQSEPPKPRHYTGYQGLKGLTRKEVDPDYDGDDIAFAAKYGHVNLFTKEQIEANRQEQLVQGLCNGLKAAAQSLAIELPTPEAWQAWLAKPRKKEKAAEWLEPIEKALAIFSR